MALRVFQPTLPARGATLFQHIGQCRQPCISTHAPRTGSDDWLPVKDALPPKFQPTLPARGATT